MNAIRVLLSILILVIISTLAVGQVDKTAQATRFDKAPVIDGVVDEEVWQSATRYGNLIQFSPQHGEPSDLTTWFRIGYDDKAIYVAIISIDPDPDKISASITKRDQDLGEDDAVAVFLDTFNDDQTASCFVTNLLGTQWDFRTADNGRSMDSSWDATWYCAATQTDEGWSAEFAIPFNILRFNSGDDQTWGVHIGRAYPRNLQVDYWTGPLEDELRTSQFGELTGITPPVLTDRYQIIPYALTQIGEDQKSESKTGLDVRYRISNNLSADVTINPDFAIIEADAEQINLTRFELRVSEKRPFFLEGAEFFNQRIDQFYSRRIGEIPWGAKVQGKVAGMDIAMIAAQSDPAKTHGDTELEGTEATYTVIRAKKGLARGSNIGLLAANRDWLGESKGSVGLDTTLFFSDTFGMTAQIVRAHGPENDGALAWFLRPAYDSANTHFHVRYSNWDKGLMDNMNAIGFIRDDDRKEVDSNLRHTFWLNNSFVENIQFSDNYNRYWSKEGVLRSWENSAELEVEFTNKWKLEIEREDEFKLYEKEFQNDETSIEIGYDNRAGRSYDISYGFGVNEDNDLKLIRGGTSFKVNDSLNISYHLTRLWLDPDPDEETTWIHSIRGNYYFDKDFYLKLFYQTNSVINKKNAQVVLVWRFIPPFGSFQLAYQHGTSRIGTRSDQGHTLFTKLSWVF